MITIWRASLDAFCSRGTGTVRGNITILRNMGMMTKEELWLEGLFPLLVTYPLNEGVLMGVTRVTSILSFRKGGYVGKLQWYIMGKPPTAWANIYGAVEL